MTYPTRSGFGESADGTLAVVVTGGVTDFLPDTLSALAQQTHRPDRILLVDVGPGDPALGATVLDAGFDAEDLEALHVPRVANFGSAVRLALGRVDMAGIRWLWFLHDDSAPESTALAELVRAVEFAPSVAIAGCKQLLGAEGPLLAEVGVTTTRFGRRMSGIEEGELDQGQHDTREDVLGVGTAGMLVEASVWADLGGTDPALGPYRDGLDLCRRARLAGHRVIVVPSAVVHHHQASYRGLRRGGVERTGRSFGARRRALLHTRLTWCSALAVPLWAVAMLPVGIARALWRLLIKDFDLAWAEIAAPAAVLAHPERVAQARRQASAHQVLARRALRGLEMTSGEARRIRREQRLGQRDRRRADEAPTDMEVAELRALARTRRWALAAVTGALILLDVLVLGRLLGAGAVVGAGLDPYDGDLGSLWHAALSSWHYAGLGDNGAADPLTLVLSLPAALALGHVQVGIDALILLVIPLAGLGAWFAAGAANRGVWLRVVAVGVWIASPSLWLALDAGRLGALLAHAALPWFVLCLVRAVGVDRRDDVVPVMAGRSRRRRAPVSVTVSSRSGPGSISDAALAGLLLAVVVAGAPALLIPGLAALLVAGMCVPRRSVRLVVTALPVLALLAPNLLAAARVGGSAWRALLADPGRPLASTPAPAWMQLLGWPQTPQTWPGPLASLGPWPALAACGLLAAWAALALVRRGPLGRGVRAGWALAALTLGVSALAGRVVTAVLPASTTSTGASASVAGATASQALATAQSASQAVVPWAGSFVSVVTACLLAAALVGANLPDGAARTPSTTPRRVLAVAVLALAAVGPLAQLGVAAVRERSDGSLHTQQRVPVPSIVVEAMGSPQASHALWIDPSAGVLDWSVLRGPGPQLTDWTAAYAARTVTGSLAGPAPAPPDAAEADLDRIVAGLARRSDQDLAGALVHAGIAFVVVPDDSGSSDRLTELVSSLDAAPGLSRIAGTTVGIAYRVDAGQVEDSDAAPLPGRVWLQDSDGALTQVLSAGPTEVDLDLAAETPAGRLVLAERADTSWRATLDGRAVPSTTDGWRQAFDLPAGGGRLHVAYLPARTGTVGWARAAVGVGTVLLALPLRRRRAESD